MQDVLAAAYNLEDKEKGGSRAVSEVECAGRIMTIAYKEWLSRGKPESAGGKGKKSDQDYTDFQYEVINQIYGASVSIDLDSFNKFASHFTTRQDPLFSALSFFTDSFHPLHCSLSLLREEGKKWRPTPILGYGRCSYSTWSKEMYTGPIKGCSNCKPHSKPQALDI